MIAHSKAREGTVVGPMTAANIVLVGAVTGRHLRRGAIEQGGQAFAMLIMILALGASGCDCACNAAVNGPIDSGPDPDAITPQDAGGTPADAGSVDAGSVDAGSTDASEAPDANEILDAGAMDAVVADAAGLCVVGTATSAATATTASLFGERVPFAADADLPAGRYLLEYVDGCFKFASSQAWTIHARDDGTVTWWLVGATSADLLIHLPGIVGYTDPPAFNDFAACVAANRLLPPIEYDHTGGRLGIWLADTNYPDNVAGEGDVNPEWRLSRIGPCDGG